MLLALGALAIREGIRLAMTMRQPGFYDVVGPDRYLLIVGSALILIGLIHIGSERERRKIQGWGEKDQSLTQVLWIVGGLALYVALIPVLGYLSASVVFFLLVMRVLGLSSWMVNGVLSVLMALVFQFIFGKLLGVILPPGILGIWAGL